MSPMADKVFKKTPEQKLSEATEGYRTYRAQEAAAHANMLKLRAERLTREAANQPPAEPVTVKLKTRKKIIRR